MTELVARAEKLPAELVMQQPTTPNLGEWVADLENAYTLATKICTTPFTPAAFKAKPADAAVAILYGKGLNLDPLASLNAIFVISGRPGLYAKAMHAIVTGAGHEVWVDAESETSVTVKGQRNGSEHVMESTWTIDRASKAGYLSNSKYKTDPISMLKARAIGDVCRVVAPDALAGLSYNEADVALMGPVEDLGEAPKTRTVSLADIEPEPAPEAVS